MIHHFQFGLVAGGVIIPLLNPEPPKTALIYAGAATSAFASGGDRSDQVVPRQFDGLV